MANYNIQFAGQRLLAGDRRHLFQDSFGDLISCLMGPLRITSGRVYRRAATGRCGGGRAVSIPVITDDFPVSWHTPGVEIIGSRAPITTKRLTADQVMIASVAVDIEEYYVANFLRAAKKRVPVEYIPHLTNPLARTEDLQTFITMIRAARGHYEDQNEYPSSLHHIGKSGYGNSHGSDPITAPPGAPYQTANGVARKQNYSPAYRLPVNFTVDDIKKQIQMAMCHFDKLGMTGGWDEHGGVRRDIYIYMRPEIFGMLVADGAFMNRDFGGLGSYAYGTLQYALGFEVINTPILPGWNNLNIDFPTPELANRPYLLDVSPPVLPGSGTIYGKYAVENPFTTAMIIAHKKSVGRIYYEDIVYEEEWSLDHLSTLGVAWTFTGGGILCAEGVVEVCYAEPPYSCDSVIDGQTIQGYNNPANP